MKGVYLLLLLCTSALQHALGSSTGGSTGSAGSSGSSSTGIDSGTSTWSWWGTRAEPLQVPRSRTLVRPVELPHSSNYYMDRSDGGTTSRIMLEATTSGFPRWRTSLYSRVSDKLPSYTARVGLRQLIEFSTPDPLDVDVAFDPSNSSHRVIWTTSFTGKSKYWSQYGYKTVSTPELRDYRFGWTSFAVDTGEDGVVSRVSVCHSISASFAARGYNHNSSIGPNRVAVDLVIDNYPWHQPTGSRLAAIFRIDSTGAREEAVRDPSDDWGSKTISIGTGGRYSWIPTSLLYWASTSSTHSSTGNCASTGSSTGSGSTGAADTATGTGTSIDTRSSSSTGRRHDILDSSSSTGTSGDNETDGNSSSSSTGSNSSDCSSSNSSSSSGGVIGSSSTGSGTSSGGSSTGRGSRSSSSSGSVRRSSSTGSSWHCNPQIPGDCDDDDDDDDWHRPYPKERGDGDGDDDHDHDEEHEPAPNQQHPHPHPNNMPIITPGIDVAAGGDGDWRHLFPDHHHGHHGHDSDQEHAREHERGGGRTPSHRKVDTPPDPHSVGDALFFGSGNDNDNSGRSRPPHPRNPDRDWDWDSDRRYHNEERHTHHKRHTKHDTDDNDNDNDNGKEHRERGDGGEHSGDGVKEGGGGVLSEVHARALALAHRIHRLSSLPSSPFARDSVRSDSGDMPLEPQQQPPRGSGPDGGGGGGGGVSWRHPEGPSGGSNGMVTSGKWGRRRFALYPVQYRFGIPTSESNDEDDDDDGADEEETSDNVIFTFSGSQLRPDFLIFTSTLSVRDATTVVASASGRFRAMHPLLTILPFASALLLLLLR